MTRRRLLLALGLGLAGTVAVSLAFTLCSKRKSLLRERFDRVQVGMTADEAHAIMGRRGGGVGSVGEYWLGVPGGDYEEAIIYFADGRVTRKSWEDESDWVKPTWREGMLDSIREFFGR